jgi:F-type H+-transporting ATPase subunit beta
MPETLMVFGEMDESPGLCFRLRLAALTYAEYLRDSLQKEPLPDGQHVPLRSGR